MNNYEEELKLLVKKADDISRAMDMTDEIANKMGFIHYDRLFLRLVTEEACMNAYEYCQKTNQQGFWICWDHNHKDCLSIFIKHRGKKFAITPMNGINRGLRGRGLHLIVNLMDYVQVQGCGEYVELVMTKCITQNLKEGIGY
ncbi:ATP-binding protein [Schinkia azotoformans]|uniref:ATP-binding protein n=1 Tax=Schinkia azotoformans TaxID=1454 RepID=UPI002E245BCB|nr:ATP-binding protein [Schinkia azotoformans]